MLTASKQLCSRHRHCLGSHTSQHGYPKPRLLQQRRALQLQQPLLPVPVLTCLAGSSKLGPAEIYLFLKGLLQLLLTL